MADISKPFWKSKLVWFNVLSMLTAVLVLFADQNLVDPRLFAVATGMINVVLRIWFTDTQIS